MSCSLAKALVSLSGVISEIIVIVLLPGKLKRTFTSTLLSILRPRRAPHHNAIQQVANVEVDRMSDVGVWEKGGERGEEGNNPSIDASMRSREWWNFEERCTECERRRQETP